MHVRFMCTVQEVGVHYGLYTCKGTELMVLG